jgi:hypothetical protein
LASRCTVCSHPERAEIDHAVLVDRVAERVTANRYGISQGALHRHRVNHLSEALVEIHRTVRRELDLRVFDGLQRIYTRMTMVIDACDKQLYDTDTGEYRVDLTAIVPLVQASAELRKTIESAAKFYAQVEAERQLQEAAEGQEDVLKGIFAEVLAPTAEADLAWAMEGLLDAETARKVAEYAAPRLHTTMIERLKGG